MKIIHVRYPALSYTIIYTNKDNSKPEEISLYNIYSYLPHTDEESSDTYRYTPYN